MGYFGVGEDEMVMFLGCCVLADCESSGPRMEGLILYRLQHGLPR